jgi:alkylation response protein AidB-like acyl-CoA dehydrogenase
VSVPRGECPLPEHVEVLRETLVRFVETEMPRSAARAWDRDDHFPRAVFEKLVPLGVLGTTVDEKYGGTGRDVLATVVTIEQLARRSIAVANPYIMAACYAGLNIAECGSEEQKADLLPRVVAGDLLFAYGLTEPDVGSDLANVRTTARRDGDSIVLSGAKRFCTGADYADFIYCLANTDPDGTRRRNLSLLLVPPASEGVVIEPQRALGMKGTHTCDVTFSEVRLPVSAIVGGELGWNEAWGMMVGPGLEVEKLEVAALALGFADAAVEDAWNYSQEREQFGKPIAAIQSIRHMLADAQTDLFASRMLVYRVAEVLSRGQSAPAETSMTKLFVTEAACRIVLICQKIMGAYGYVDGFDMERYVRDVLATPIFGGSSAIQRNNITNLLGLPRG